MMRVKLQRKFHNMQFDYLLRRNGTSSNGQALDMELELNLLIIVIKGQYARQLQIEISRAR